MDRNIPVEFFKFILCCFVAHTQPHSLTQLILSGVCVCVYTVLLMSAGNECTLDETHAGLHSFTCKTLFYNQECFCVQFCVLCMRSVNMIHKEIPICGCLHAQVSMYINPAVLRDTNYEKCIFQIFQHMQVHCTLSS